MLTLVKTALRITTNIYDAELNLLIEAALDDLWLVGCKEYTSNYPPLIQIAVITYVRLHFGSPEDYDRLKLSYDEQKAQIIMSTPYTRRIGY